MICAVRGIKVAGLESLRGGDAKTGKRHNHHEAVEAHARGGLGQYVLAQHSAL